MVILYEKYQYNSPKSGYYFDAWLIRNVARNSAEKICGHFQVSHVFLGPANFQIFQKKRLGSKSWKFREFFQKVPLTKVGSKCPIFLEKKAPELFSPSTWSLLINYDEAVPALEGWPHAGLG